MNYVELSVSAALVFQLIQLGGIALPGFYNLCILVAVVLCFLYLIGTRLFPNGISSVLFSRGHAAAALAACVFLIAIFFLVTHFAYGPAQQGILHAWEALKATAGTVASALSSGIMYLLSLLPEVEVEGGALPPPQSSSSDAEIMEQASAMLPAWLMPAAILGMIVLLLLIVTLVLPGYQTWRSSETLFPAQHSALKKATRPCLAVWESGSVDCLHTCDSVCFPGDTAIPRRGFFSVWSAGLNPLVLPVHLDKPPVLS